MGVYNHQIGSQGDRTPVYRHSILGFRGWAIHRPTDGSPVHLRSPYIASCVWTEPELSARCLQWGDTGTPKRKTLHKAPHQDCSCGLYGYYDPFDRRSHGPIRGAIAASGTVQVHADGFRAERVRILALALPVDAADLPIEELEAQERVIREIAAYYRVPALEPAELEAYCAEHATHVPKHLRPEAKPPPAKPNPPPIKASDFNPTGLVALAGLFVAAGIAAVSGGLRVRRG